MDPSQEIQGSQEETVRPSALIYARKLIYHCIVFRLPGVDVDIGMTHHLPSPPSVEVTSADPICSSSQSTFDDRFALEVQSGANIMLLYQENGHITLSDIQVNKPSAGNVFVYGTFVPRPDDALLSIHKVWNTDKTGGDQRGFLLTAQPFDDGRCYQKNTGAISQQRQQSFPDRPSFEGDNFWCGTNLTLPSLERNSLLTLYWVWDWPSVDPHGAATEDFYTTCIDLRVE